MQGRLSGFLKLLCKRPYALAVVKGSEEYPEICGEIRFYGTGCGTLVYADISSLPISQDSCGSYFFGFHIHTGSSCSGDKNDPFSDAKSHYNPKNYRHPHHAGDMPPLLSKSGRAFCVFLAEGFKVDEIVGKTVIIHSSPDDFTTQPSGNSGIKIACGEIRNINAC